MLKAQELFFRTEELLNQLLIVPVSQAASLEFDRLRAVSKYRKIGRADLLIASITLANQATLVPLRGSQPTPNPSWEGKSKVKSPKGYRSAYQKFIIVRVSSFSNGCCIYAHVH